MVHIDHNHVLVDKALLVIMTAMPISSTLTVDDFIQKAKRFIDVHDLWLDDENENGQDKKPFGQRIIQLSPTLKHLLNIHVEHRASMVFWDFIKLATR